jgi:NADPH2:quinone reductase
MKAIFCEEHRAPLVLREIDPPPSPGEGEVKVAIRARSVSFVDVLQIAGEYQVLPDLPFIPGSEGTGEVIEVGANVEGFQVGSRVLVDTGCVEQVVLPADRVTPLPDNVDFETGASFRANYMTALLALQRGQLRAGETVLVHGAAGGVGLATVDVGKLMGATVIATASTAEKLDVVRRMGADHVINYSDGFREQVKDLTAGRGADVTLDPVGGDVFDESMRCIAPYGRILIIGFTGGRPALAKTNHLLIKDASVIGLTLGAFTHREPAKAEKNFRTLLGWLASGRISPYYSHKLPLEQTTEALALITGRQVMGKVVIVSA